MNEGYSQAMRDVQNVLSDTIAEYQAKLDSFEELDIGAIQMYRDRVAVVTLLKSKIEEL